MRKLSVLLALMALFVVEAAFANAVATMVSGTVQVQTGTAAPRLLRQGDTVRQGDTLVTGAGSALVLRFEDGQVAALTANSRMTVTAYQYEAGTGSGNVLLSLVRGGMRAITGLIGRTTPQRVSYRAATATIGIRGTDVTLVTDTVGNVVVTVTEGLIAFTFNGKTIEIPAGQGVNARVNEDFRQQAIAEIIRQAPPEVIDAIGGLGALTSAIQDAAAGNSRTTIAPGNNVTPSGGSSTSVASPH